MTGSRPLFVLLTALVAACSAAPEGTTSTLPATTTAPAAVTTPTVAPCADEFEFGEGGQIADLDHDASDSGTIGAISWTEEADCESFTIAFQTSEGAPATTPPSTELLHLESFQVLRVQMSNVDATVVTDQLVETSLVDRLFVVRSLEEGMFIDFHLAQPSQARIEAASSPAQLILTLKPGLVPFTGFSTIGERVVVTSPTAGAMVDSVFTIGGYSRTLEAGVLFVASIGSEVVAERSTVAAAWMDTWGEYRANLALPEGTVSLFVGEADQLDGTLEGVTVRMTVR